MTAIVTTLLIVGYLVLGIAIVLVVQQILHDRLNWDTLNVRDGDEFGLVVLISLIWPVILAVTIVVFVLWGLALLVNKGVEKIFEISSRRV